MVKGLDEVPAPCFVTAHTRLLLAGLGCLEGLQEEGERLVNPLTVLVLNMVINTVLNMVLNTVLKYQSLASTAS